MLRKLTRYIFFSTLTILSVACSDDFSSPADGRGTVTITLSNSHATRSTDSDNSETKIDNVVIALYPSAGDDNTPATAQQTFSGLGANGSAKVQMTLTEEMVQTLFANQGGAACRMYAVANINGSEIPENATIAQLKNIAVTSEFASKKVQSMFVMAGAGQVTLSKTGDTASATGSAVMARAAAKINLNIKLPESVTSNGETWRPVTEANGIRALLNNGVAKSRAVPGDPGVDSNWTPPTDDEYFSITAGDISCIRYLSDTETGEYPYQTDVPFYTYPNQWEETPDENHKTFLRLLVTWQKDGDSQWLTFYYQVPVTDMNKLIPNGSYTINLNVGMLGSLSPETPEELTDLSYQIVDWNKEDIDVSINDQRYLVVNPTLYTVNNEEEMSIPFYTSHPVEISDISMEYNRFNYYNNGNGEVVTIPITKAQIDDSFVDTDSLCTYHVRRDPISGQNTIVIRHPLKIWEPYASKTATTPISLTGRADNSLQTVINSIRCYKPSTSNSDVYSPYTIKATIRHKDNPAFSETITVTQNPGMYIEHKPNPGGGINDTGNVFVNNSNTTGGNYGGVHGLTGGNKNPNMYIINISTLSSGSEYIIGDPRTQYTNNNLSTETGSGRNKRYPDMTTPTINGDVAGDWCLSATSLYQTDVSNRSLQYYYPTIESQENQYKMMVAPKFRVASSFGVTMDINRDAARRRIATYQEMACPAGRWRLPTYGELQFIITLSSTGKIPVLFSIGSDYWTAQGICTVNSNGTITLSNRTSDEAAVRGIYDEWYWEQQSDYVIYPNASGNYTYTLGDMPRNVTRSNALIKKYKNDISKKNSMTQ